MNQNPLEQLETWLRRNSLTQVEKNRMKQVLVSYATKHPVKSGLTSPYAFRFFGVALASLMLVLGGSVGVTNAAQNALPNQKLYPVKIWVEEFQARAQKTPEAAIAFETKRITERFEEASELALRRALDAETSLIVQSGLEHSRANVQAIADTLETTDPALALEATNALETAFSSNGRLLASIERNTDQNIGTIVLAAEVTTQKLALEKVKFEQIVALVPNASSEIAARAKFAEVASLVAAGNPAASVDALADEPTTLAMDDSETPQDPSLDSEADVAIAATAIATMMAIDDPGEAPDAPENPAISTASLATEAPDDSLARSAAIAPIAPNAKVSADTEIMAPVAEPTDADRAATLIAEAEEKMELGLFSEALVLLQKAEQLVKEANLDKSLEATYRARY